MAQEPQSPLCSSCPHNVIGSAIGYGGGKVKACGDLKKLAVVVNGFDGVYLLEIKPGSFKAWNNYTNLLRMQKLADGGRPDLSDVVTRVRFAGQGTLSFEAVQFTNDREDLVEQVIDVWEKNKQGDLTGSMIGRYDQPAQGVVPYMAEAQNKDVVPVQPAGIFSPTSTSSPQPATAPAQPLAKAVRGRPMAKKPEEEKNKPPPPSKEQQPAHGMAEPQKGPPPSEVMRRLDRLVKLPTVK